MVTYNHEKFIDQAIESVLFQRTSFPMKLFIGEDCSSDKTAAICLKYEVENPEVIEVIFNKRNIGATNNAVKTYDVCFSSGAKYIAMLEGDDYWTDPYKLQKQVDFLEANDDFALCACCNTVVNCQNGQDYITYKENNNSDKVFLYSDILQNQTPFKTGSIVFRNYFQDGIPEWFSKAPFGDLLIMLFCCQFGKAILLKDIMSVYRIHNEGMWSKLKYEDQLKLKMSFYSFISKKFPSKYKREIINEYLKIFTEFSKYYFKERQFHKILYLELDLFMLCPTLYISKSFIKNKIRALIKKNSLRIFGTN